MDGGGSGVETGKFYLWMVVETGNMDGVKQVSFTCGLG